MHLAPRHEHEEIPSFRELMDDFAKDVAALMHDEIDLVSREMRSELRMGLMILGVLSVCSAAAILTLGAAAVLALSRVVDAPVAALIVGLAFAVVAVAVGAWTRKHQRRMDLIPGQTLKTLS